MAGTHPLLRAVLVPQRPAAASAVGHLPAEADPRLASYQQHAASVAPAQVVTALNVGFPVVMALVAATSALLQLAHGWRAGQVLHNSDGRTASRSHHGVDAAPVVVLWDIENCSVPAAATPWSVAAAVTGSLRSCGFTGPVWGLFAYGDFALMPPATRRQLQSTGWRLCDVPSGRKDAADRALQLDLLLFARECPAPAVVLLISGDRDFAPSMHRLRGLNYITLIAAPVATANVAKELTCSAARVFDWASLACGLVQFEEKARTESRAADQESSIQAVWQGAVASSPQHKKTRAAEVTAFVAAASEAIEAEDVEALERVVSTAKDSGLRVTREQEALEELKRKLRRRQQQVVQARARLHDALAQGNAMLAEAALMNARAQGVALFLQPEVEAASALVQATRAVRDDEEEGDDDEDEEEGGETTRRSSPRAPHRNGASPVSSTGVDDPLAVLSELDASPEWYRRLLAVGTQSCDHGMLQYALERASEDGLDTAPAVVLLGAVSRARSLAGALQKALLRRDMQSLAGLLGILPTGSTFHRLMPAEYAEAWAALHTMREQQQQRRQRVADGEDDVDDDRDELPRLATGRDADALRERIAAALEAEDGPALRAALLDGALRLRIPAQEADLRRLKSLVSARDCVVDLQRAAQVRSPVLLRNRILRAQRDYITRHPTRNFPKDGGQLLSTLTAALEEAKEAEILLLAEQADTQVVAEDTQALAR